MILPTSKIFEAEKSERSSIVTILLCEYRIFAIDIGKKAITFLFWIPSTLFNST